MELLDREAFLNAVREGRMIVITDSATGNKLHRPECVWVDEQHFVRKVLDNGKRNGRYYAVDSAEDARSSFAAVACHVCFTS